jgi:hypothetical protein
VSFSWASIAFVREEARPLFRTADPVSSSKIQHYDGFVIGWIFGETSTLKLNAALRAEMHIARLLS